MPTETGPSVATAASSCLLSFWSTCWYLEMFTALSPVCFFRLQKGHGFSIPWYG